MQRNDLRKYHRNRKLGKALHLSQVPVSPAARCAREAGLDGLVAGVTRELIELRYGNELTEEIREELMATTTTTEAYDVFQRGMQELERRGERRGRREMLRRMADQKFGGEAGRAWAEVLEAVDDPARLDQVADAIVDGQTFDALMDRARRLAAQ